MCVPCPHKLMRCSPTVDETASIECFAHVESCNRWLARLWKSISPPENVGWNRCAGRAREVQKTTVTRTQRHSRGPLQGLAGSRQDSHSAVWECGTAHEQKEFIAGLRRKLAAGFPPLSESQPEHM